MPGHDDLFECKYQTLIFPCDEFQLSAPNSIVKREPFLGPTFVEDAGPRSRTGTLSIPVFNDIGYGSIYPSLVLELWQLFGAQRKGRLVHPLFGPINVGIDNFDIKASSDERDGVRCMVNFTIDRADADRDNPNGGTTDGTGNRSTPDDVSAGGRAVDDAVNNLYGSFA